MSKLNLQGTDVMRVLGEILDGEEGMTDAKRAARYKKISKSLTGGALKMLSLFASKPGGDYLKREGPGVLTHTGKGLKGTVKYEFSDNDLKQLLRAKLVTAKKLAGPIGMVYPNNPLAQHVVLHTPKGRIDRGTKRIRFEDVSKLDILLGQLREATVAADVYPPAISEPGVVIRRKWPHEKRKKRGNAKSISH